MRHQTAELSWAGDVPVSELYQDPYFSLEDGVAESIHVFLAGNGLPGRFRAGFRIAELGFGTGLNLILALRAARASGALPLCYTGFEAHPISPEAMARALSAFPEISEDARALAIAWEKGTSIDTNELSARVLLGSAEKTLPAWDGCADAWFLDGFAPARNPTLWTPALMSEVARHTAKGGTFATYTAAGHVRRGLAAAGFAVERRPGFGRKRHMSVGCLR
ncbi:MAG: tRNA (5-methylaminomethyl-2-thiouridine)(34)-methyltransferase MnmD [Pseudomonadota bacterium]